MVEPYPRKAAINHLNWFKIPVYSSSNRRLSVTDLPVADG